MPCPINDACSTVPTTVEQSFVALLMVSASPYMLHTWKAVGMNYTKMPCTHVQRLCVPQSVRLHTALPTWYFWVHCTSYVAGGRDIGGACAIELARAGADVVINYHSSATAAEETADKVRALGRRALAVQADVFSEDGVAKLYQEANDFAETGIDVLICNAGGLNVRGEL